MNSLMNYEQKLINRKCQVFGKMFSRSILMKYDSKNFVEQVMTFNKYIDYIVLDDGYEWCDECFLFRLLENVKAFTVSEEQISSFELWFMGYFYKYWMLTRKKLPNEIYKIMPYDVFHNRFAFYHTQGWEYIINDANSLPIA